MIDEHAETTLEASTPAARSRGTHGRNRMMGNSLLECCVFGPRRQGGRCESELMTTTVDTDLYGAVEDAAAHLLRLGAEGHPAGSRDALAAARGKETSTTGGACST